MAISFVDASHEDLPLIEGVPDNQPAAGRVVIVNSLTDMIEAGERSPVTLETALQAEVARECIDLKLTEEMEMAIAIAALVKRAIPTICDQNDRSLLDMRVVAMSALGPEVVQSALRLGDVSTMYASGAYRGRATTRNRSADEVKRMAHQFALDAYGRVQNAHGNREYDPLGLKSIVQNFDGVKRVIAGMHEKGKILNKPPVRAHII